MSEEEIIKIITYKLNMKDTDVYAPILYDEIRALLDLYNKEKEKNKELEKKYNKIIDFANDLLMQNKNSISKDKIKEKIESKIAYCRAEELEDSYIGDKHSKYWEMYRELLEKIEQELLEGE